MGSRFQQERAAERQRLCVALVRAVTGLHDSPSASAVARDNAAQAVRFAVENLANAQPSELWRGEADALATLKAVADKLRAHSERARAARLEALAAQLRAAAPVGLFVPLASLLHLLSHAPSHEGQLQEDAALLAARSVADAAVAERATPHSTLASEIRTRLAVSKRQAVEEEARNFVEGVDEDWLEQLAAEGDSDALSEDASDALSDALSEDASDESDASDEGGSGGSGDEAEAHLERADELEEQQLSASPSSAWQEVESGGALDEHLNARVRRAKAGALPVHAAADRLVHEAEMTRAVLQMLHGHAPALLPRRGGAAVSLAHTTAGCVTSFLAPLERAAQELSTVRAFCRARGPRLHGLEGGLLCEQGLCERLAWLLRGHEAAFTEAERSLCALRLRPEAAERGMPTLLALSLRLRRYFSQVAWLASLVTRLEQLPAALAPRRRAKAVLEQLFELALDEHVVSAAESAGAAGTGLVAEAVLVLERPALGLFASALLPHVRVLGELLEHGQAPDPLGEFWLAVTATDVLVEDAPSFWAPVQAQVVQSCRALRLLRQLSLDERRKRLAWPPAALRGCRVLAEFQQHMLDGGPGVAATPLPPARSHRQLLDCELLLREPLFRGVEERCARVAAEALKVVLHTHELLGQLRAMRGLFLAQSGPESVALARFLRDLFLAADRDCAAAAALPAAVRDVVRSHAEEDRGWLCRLPAGVLDAAASDAPGRAEVITALLASDLEEAGAPRALYERVRVTLAAGPAGPAGLAGPASPIAAVRVVLNAQQPLSEVADAGCLTLHERVLSLLLRVGQTQQALLGLQHDLRKRALHRKKTTGASEDRAAQAQEHWLLLALAEQVHLVGNLHAYVVQRCEQHDRAVQRRLALADSLDEMRATLKAELRLLASACMLPAADAESGPHSAPAVAAPTLNVSRAVLELMDLALLFRNLALAHSRGVPGLVPHLEAAHQRWSKANRFLLVMIAQRATGVRHIEDLLTRLDFAGQHARRQPRVLR